MVTVTSLIHAAASAPKMEGCTPGVCRTCGSQSSGLPFDAWVRDTFTDNDKLKPGEIVCYACQFCFTDRNAQLGSLVGKAEPQRMRNYSHFVVGGKWIPLSKGAKSKMAELLLDHTPAAAIVADSGQKHIIFRARVGWWQFEEAAIRPEPLMLRSLLFLIELLYRGGFSKEEIRTGRYDQTRILKFGVAIWRELENEAKSVRGGLLFDLALFLAQKGGDDDDD